MIGSATNLSTAKKLLGVLVAIAMVLTMSNVAVWTADAEENANQAAKTKVVDTEESNNVESSHTDEEADTPVVEEKEEIVNNNESSDADDEEVDDPEVKDATENVDNNDEASNTDEATNEKVEVGGGNSEENISAQSNTHSISITINVYQDGELYKTLLLEESAAMNLPVYVDSRDFKAFINSAEATVGAGYAKDKVEPAFPSDLNIKVPGSYSSKSFTYNMYFAEDVVVDPYNIVDTSRGADGVPDKYQKEVTYQILNGAWDKSGDVADKTEVVTFYGDGLSNSSDAIALLHLPNIDPNPKQYFKESGSWNIDTREPVISWDDPTEYCFTYDHDDSMHVITSTIEYYLDEELYQTVQSNTIGPMNYELVYNFNHQVFDRDTNPLKKNTILDRVECDFDYTQNYISIDAYDEDYSLGVIKVFYMADAIGTVNPNASDKVPDKYQIKVNYEIVNGYLVNESDSTKVYTLYNGSEFDENGRASIILPSSKPHEGFINDTTGQFGGGWNEPGWSSTNNSVRLTKADDGKTFVKTYVASASEYIVFYFDDELNIPILEAETYPARYLDTILTKDKVIDINGYVYSYANKDELVCGLDPSNNSITLFYDQDANNDGIADKYQVRVTYSAVNGTVRGNTSEIVTLRDANGNPAVGGTGKLASIPTFRAEAGYSNPTWSAAGEPTANTVITQDTHFIVTYSKTTASSNGNGGSSSDKGSNSGSNGSNSGSNGGSTGGSNGASGLYNPTGGTNPGFVSVTDPTDGDNAEDADEADEESIDDEGEELEIADEENPLAEAEDSQVIVDDENALSDYAEPAFNWIPLAIVAGIVILGGCLFLIARKKRNEDEARSSIR